MAAMTTTTRTTTADVAVRPVRPARTDPVRRILTIDAAFCILASTTLLASAAPIADHADLASPTVVQAIGAFLLLLGVGLAVLARAPQRRARLGTAVTGLGDVGWAVGSLVLVVAAGLPAWATVAVVVQAVLTLGIAIAKRAALRSAAQ